MTAVVPRTWTQAGAIARALLWEGVNRYERENHETLAAAVEEHGDGWWFTCDPNLASSCRAVDVARKVIAEITSRDEAELPRTELTNKKRAFDVVRVWAERVAPPSAAPLTPSDWAALGDLAFWIGKEGIQGALGAACRNVVPSSLLPELSISELAQFVSGRCALEDQGFLDWLDRSRVELRSRFIRETGSLAVVEDRDAITVLFPVAIRDETVSADPKANDFHAQAMERVTILRHLFPKHSTIGSKGIGAGVLSALGLPDDTEKAIPAENLPLTREVQVNATFRNLVSFRLQRSSSWREYAESIFAHRRAACDALHGLYRGWGRFIEHQRIKAEDFRNMPGLELSKLEASRIHKFPRTAVDEWGLVSEDSSRGGTEADAGAQVHVWGNIRRFTEWRRAWNEYESAVGRVGACAVEVSVLHLATKNFGSDSLADSKAGRLLVINLGVAWKQLQRIQHEFRQWFAKYIPDAGLSELERHEEATFAHLWPVVFAVVYSPYAGCGMGEGALESGLREERRAFVRGLRRELTNVLGAQERARVLEGPYCLADKRCLLALCDHSSVAEVERTQEEIIKAAWRATRFKEWKPLEYTHLEAAWSDLLFVHTVRGKALSGAGHFVSTLSLFASEADFVVKPHHRAQLPVALDVVGVPTWDLPVVAGAQLLAARAGLFTFAMMTFPAVAEAAEEFRLEAEHLECWLRKYSREITALRSKAVTAFEDLLALLRNSLDTANGGPIAEVSKRLEMICEPLLLLDGSSNVTLTPERFGEWAAYVLSHPRDLQNVVTELVEFSLTTCPN